MTSGIDAFSAAVSAGKRLYCWKTKPMFLARNRVRSRSPIAVTLLPKMVTSPSSQSRMPAMTDRSVVLPHPDGPTSSDICPLETSQSTPRSACTRRSPDPKCLVTPRMRTATSSPVRVGFAIMAVSGASSHMTSHLP